MEQILTLIIILALTGAVGSSVAYVYFFQLEESQSYANIRLENVAAVERGDTVIITGTIHQGGPAVVQAVLIGELAVGDLVMYQDAPIKDKEPQPGFGFLTVRTSACETGRDAELEGNSWTPDGTCTGGGVVHLNYGVDRLSSPDRCPTGTSITTTDCAFRLAEPTAPATGDGLLGSFPPHEVMRFRVVIEGTPGSFFHPDRISTGLPGLEGDPFRVQFAYVVDGDAVNSLPHAGAVVG